MPYDVDPDLIAYAASMNAPPRTPAARDDWRTLRTQAEAGLSLLDATAARASRGRTGRPHRHRGGRHRAARALVRPEPGPRARAGGRLPPRRRDDPRIGGDVRPARRRLRRRLGCAVPLGRLPGRARASRTPRRSRTASPACEWLVEHADELRRRSRPRRRHGRQRGRRAGGRRRAPRARSGCPVAPADPRVSDARRPHDHCRPRARAVRGVVVRRQLHGLARAARRRCRRSRRVGRTPRPRALPTCPVSPRRSSTPASSTSSATSASDYARRIGATGTSVELHVHPGCPHGYDRMPIPVAERAVADRIRVLRRL